MASTTTVYRTADWTTAETAHGPTLAAWLREVLPHSTDPQDHDGLQSRYGASFSRFIRRCEEPNEFERGGDHMPSFWTVDKWLTHVNLHPGMAPYGTWSLEPTHRRAERRAA